VSLLIAIGFFVFFKFVLISGAAGISNFAAQFGK